MTPISVVIIAKNEAHVIGHTLKAIENLTDDIIVVDSGSTDGTHDIVRNFKAQLIQTTWDGFGQNKNKGAAVARYDWILNLDADEVMQRSLFNALKSFNLMDENYVYAIHRVNFLGSHAIKHGEWGNDEITRLYNRNKTQWNNALVHETLENHSSLKREVLPGSVHHLTALNLEEYATKMTEYALLNAEHYHKQGKKSGWLKRNLSAPFSFVQNYIFKLGFLDGKDGYAIARISSQHTFLKYAHLYELERLSKG